MSAMKVYIIVDEDGEAKQVDLTEGQVLEVAKGDYPCTIIDPVAMQVWDGEEFIPIPQVDDEFYLPSDHGSDPDDDMPR